MIPRPRPRILLLALAAAAIGAAFAAVGGATTLATQPSNTAPPSVSGTAKAGNTLTTTSGSWSGTTPMTFTYAWLRCDTNGVNCNSITGANAQTYDLTSDDVGHTVKSRVTAQNSAGTATAASHATGTVAGGTPPANTTLPSISGTPQVGQDLKTSTGSWSGTSPFTYKYDWRRCDASGNNCSSIGSHSDNQTYTLVDADAGHTIRVVVTASNSGGSAQATSKATAVVTVGAPANTAPPQITGSSQVDQTLTTSNGTWTGNPTSYAYQWERCDSGGNNCAAITGATATTYKTTSDDLGHAIRVVVRATSSAGSKSVESAAFGPITSNVPTGVTKLPSGELSIAAASVPDTDRLTIVQVTYKPSVTSHNHQPLQATIRVVDEHGYDVAGALVYVLGTPYNWLAKVAEAPTASNGRVTVTLSPTRAAPRHGALLVFIRARTPQGDLLAGSSTRRLVQFKLAR
ncbi:MAG TPA: hypothetical protein VGU02_16815 [Gaiellaceae bacterium]|nr:hypothetical protein [Gaiellaceae bacterium]